MGEINLVDRRDEPPLFFLGNESFAHSQPGISGASNSILLINCLSSAGQRRRQLLARALLRRLRGACEAIWCHGGTDPSHLIVHTSTINSWRNGSHSVERSVAQRLDRRGVAGEAGRRSMPPVPGPGRFVPGRNEEYSDMIQLSASLNSPSNSEPTSRCFDP